MTAHDSMSIFCVIPPLKGVSLFDFMKNNYKLSLKLKLCSFCDVAAYAVTELTS
jgi:hypothetical protein